MFSKRLNSFSALALTIFLTAVANTQASASQISCDQFYNLNIAERLRDHLKTQKESIYTAKDIGFNRPIAIIDIDKPGTTPQILIDPSVTPMTDKKSIRLEGCLRGIGGCRLVSRFDHVRIDFKDESGRKQTLELHHKLAHVAQSKLEILDDKTSLNSSLFKEINQSWKLGRQRKHLPQHSRKFIEMVESARRDSYNPYSLANDVRKHYQDEGTFERALDNLIDLYEKNSSNENFGEKLERWVTSEDHALFLYDLMASSGLDHFKNHLEYLLENSVYFSNSLRTGNALVTYSFEKEGNSSDISFLYRPIEYSEKEWLEKSDDERIEILANKRFPSKKFLGAHLVAPTDFKPPSVGGYSRELSDHRRRGYSWEFSHKKFEINPQRLMILVKEISQIFRQTHSFHIHISFELPMLYRYYSNFILWFKHLNDYLYLKGLEEGLHGNYLTGVANLDRDLSVWDKVRGFKEGIYTKRAVEESQSKLDRRNSKFFSAGLRGKIYGPGSGPNSMRLGIELRDSTRDLNILNEIVENVGKGVSQRVWEASNLDSIQEKGLRLTTAKRKTKEFLLEHVSPRHADLFSKAEPTSAFGLLVYENGPIYNYKTRSWVQVSPQKATEIQLARAEYIQDLKDIQRELGELEAKGEKTEIELITAAIRMSLATWAKKAKVSELFKQF